MKKYLALVYLFVLLASCTQTAELHITPDVVNWEFDADGGSFDVILFTNGSWTATCEDSTVVFTPESGDYTTPMHVTVGKNEEMYTKSIRIALITNYDNLARSGRVVITQSCYPFVFCEEPSKTAGPEAGIVRFSVNSDHPWKVRRMQLDGEDFPLTVDPLTHAENRAEVSVWIPANESAQARTFTVVISLEEYPEKELTLTVVQEGCAA